MALKASRRAAGSWRVVKHSWECCGIYAGGRRIATVEIDSDATEDSQDKFEAVMDADARLIAASPEMLEALEAAREQLSHSVPDGCSSTGPLTGDPIQDFIVSPGCAALFKIDVALAKAKGVT